MSSLAPRACSTCRKQKRKCNREFPACSLCLKNGRSCDYGGSSLASTGSSAANPLSAMEELSSPSPVSNQHTTQFGSPSSRPILGAPSWMRPETQISFFLDHDAFQLLEMRISPSATIFPTNVLSPTRDHGQISHDVDMYFNSIHTYFPISIMNDISPL